ncbi:hypothetical protein D3C78_737560 [compost metagenome]
MQHVADYGHREVFETALVAADGEHVEHALGRVRVAAVTAVDDGHVRADVLGDEVGGAGVGVAHHEHVGGHCLQVAQGVEQRLALAGGGGGDVEGDDVGGQPLGCQFEGGAGARGVLEEHVAHRLAAQQRDFLHRAGADFEEGVGGVEDFRQQLAGQAVEREEVAQLALVVELQRALGVCRHGAGPERLRGIGRIRLAKRGPGAQG